MAASDGILVVPKHEETKRCLRTPDLMKKITQWQDDLQLGHLAAPDQLPLSPLMSLQDSFEIEGSLRGSSSVSLMPPCCNQVATERFSHPFKTGSDVKNEQMPSLSIWYFCEPCCCCTFFHMAFIF